MTETVCVAIFDFDDTMRRGDSIAALIRYAARKGVIKPWQLPRILWGTLMYLIGFKHENHAKALALAFMKEMPVDRQEQFFQAFVGDVLLPEVYPEASDAIREHAASGDKVLIVSASPDVYMRYLSPALPAVAILATPVDAQGNLGTNCKGQEKLHRIEAWADERGVPIDWAHSHGYGDNVSDRFYLEKVGSPVAVNAGQALTAAVPGIRHVKWGNSARKEQP